MAVFETAYSGRNCNWKILESGVEQTKIGGMRTSHDETAIGVVRLPPSRCAASAFAKAPADKTVGKKAGPYDAGAVRRRSFRCWMQCSSKCATPSTVMVMREPS